MVKYGWEGKTKSELGFLLTDTMDLYTVEPLVDGKKNPNGETRSKHDGYETIDEDETLMMKMKLLINAKCLMR